MSSPVEELEAVVSEAPARIDGATSVDEIDEVEAQLLGKDSTLGRVRRSMGSLDPEDRPVVGAALQKATAEINDLLASKRAGIEAAAEKARLEAEWIDVTLESVSLPQGSLHLIQQTIDEVVDIFVGLGYQVAAGPEAELAYYNFDALNTPATHPSRLESDTMYLDFGDPADEVLLRAHTSPVQVRWMENHEPPVYIVVPGKAYRTDTIDATHLPVFHQIEGLAVDDDIQFSDLKGTLLQFAREYFGPETTVRLRPHFFPFTEPSAELDISCFNCDGNDLDCRVCSGAGWVELLGCGMVDPNVLEAVGYDPGSVSGFAFGMGVERIAQVRHGISDMRTYIDNDIRFLRQFP
ncbi:MAG: phenylalanine--tRNA ligase subunit alpha [Actinobacteria bacterium]|nr:MAG: phenylalanine--tRNA ligase subunit alpha [Actinomycetota bacterium]